jgi:intracellular septation protein
MNPLHRLGLDLGPLVAFFAANSIGGIFVATAVFMVAMSVSIAIGFAIERKISPVALVTFALVMVFGGLTIWLANDLFIKIKPTILYVMFASVLVGGLFADRLFIKYVLGQNLRLPDAAWRALTWRWGAFFAALAITNEIVWRNFSTNDWVAFKAFGVIPLTFLFTATQIPFIMRHHSETDEAPPAQ